MGAFLERYSLAAHPYDWENKLDPLVRSGDSALLVRVASYKQLDDVGDLCERAVKELRPVFFLVRGKDGCGRSSAARFIMASYCDHRKIKHENFIVPSIKAGHSDALVILKDWMTELADEMDRRKISIPAGLQQDFDDAMNASSLEAGKSKFLRLARRLAEELISSQAGFAVCLEKVTDGRVAKAVIDIFKRTQTVCVFTVGHYENLAEVVEAFDDEVKEDQKLNKNLTLKPLRGTEVRVVVEERWQQTAKIDNPFDLQAIERVFGDKERSVKRVLYLMAKFLALGANRCPNEEGWPANKKLAVQAADLAVWLEAVDQNPPL
jgi:hypothetical protein